MNSRLGTFLFAFAMTLAASLSCFAAESSPTHNARWLVDNCVAANALADGTAQQRYGAAESGSVAMSAGYCYGYLAGFQSGFSAGKHSPKELHACLPSGVNPAQIARLLEVKLKEKPEFEHVEALVFVMGVLRATWPCSD